MGMDAWACGLVHEHVHERIAKYFSVLVRVILNIKHIIVKEVYWWFGSSSVKLDKIQLLNLKRFLKCNEMHWISVREWHKPPQFHNIMGYKQDNTIWIVYKFLGEKNLFVSPPPWGNYGIVHSRGFQAQVRVHPRRTISCTVRLPAEGILWWRKAKEKFG